MGPVAGDRRSIGGRGRSRADGCWERPEPFRRSIHSPRSCGGWAAAAVGRCPGDGHSGEWADDVWTDGEGGLRGAEVVWQRCRRVGTGGTFGRGRRPRLIDGNPTRITTGGYRVDAGAAAGFHRRHIAVDPSAPARRFALSELLVAAPQWQPYLEAIVLQRLNFLICGATGSGKTTMLAAMLGTASPQERMVLVEDAAELNPGHPHVVGLQSRTSNVEGTGAVGMAELVRQALRMRPDRLVVGECRGAEVREFLAAMNTGHAGAGGTIHANSAAAVPARLAAMGALAGMNADSIALQAASALDLVISMQRTDAGRCVQEVCLLQTTDCRTVAHHHGIGCRRSRCPAVSRLGRTPRTAVPMIGLVVFLLTATACLLLLPWRQTGPTDMAEGTRRRAFDQGQEAAGRRGASGPVAAVRSAVGRAAAFGAYPVTAVAGHPRGLRSTRTAWRRAAGQRKTGSDRARTRCAGGRGSAVAAQSSGGGASRGIGTGHRTGSAPAAAGQRPAGGRCRRRGTTHVAGPGLLLGGFRKDRCTAGAAAGELCAAPAGPARWQGWASDCAGRTEGDGHPARLAAAAGTRPRYRHGSRPHRHAAAVRIGVAGLGRRGSVDDWRPPLVA